MGSNELKTKIPKFQTLNYPPQKIIMKSKMSDNIPPFEIQEEIIKLIPDVKVLIQFRSVSKLWKSLIDSPDFIGDYHTRHRNHRLLLRYAGSPEKYDSIVDDDVFPQHKIPMTVPMILSTRHHDVSMTTSQGLFCLYNIYENSSDSRTKTVLLWNPAIRKSVSIVVPNVLLYRNRKSKTVIGFGVSPHTNDPMLVKINNNNDPKYDTISCIPEHVEIFTLSTGVWRSLRTNLPRKSIEFSWHHVVIDSFIYWMGIDLSDALANRVVHSLIMSFDMTSEGFTEIPVPDCLANPFSVSISKLRESLVVLRRDQRECVVWILDYGVPSSFRKLLTIKAPDASVTGVFGFLKSGAPIIERFLDDDERLVTSVYDPCSQVTTLQ